jgi:hypothetical protein
MHCDSKGKMVIVSKTCEHGYRYDVFPTRYHAIPSPPNPIPIPISHHPIPDITSHCHHVPPSPQLTPRPTVPISPSPRHDPAGKRHHAMRQRSPRHLVSITISPKIPLQKKIYLPHNIHKNPLHVPSLHIDPQKGIFILPNVKLKEYESLTIKRLLSHASHFLPFYLARGFYSHVK